MTLTPEQAFIAEYHGSVAIDAGAGSGKTFVLTRRLLNLIVGGLRVEHLVAVTFSEAAAAELRERLQRLLDDEARRHGHENVVRAAGTLALAQISTIHALCARIIRDHPVESGAGLRFEVMDEAQTTAWLDATLPTVLAELPASDFGDVPARVALEAVRAMLDDPHRAEAALATSLATHDGALERLEAQLAQQAEREQGDWDAALRTLRAHAASDPGDALERARRAALDAADVTGSVGVRQAAMAAALAGLRANAGTAKAWGAHKVTVLHAAQRLAQLSAPDSVLSRALWQQRALPVIERLYRHAQRRLDALKAEQERLTFADLERLAAQALEHPDVQAYYAERWTAVLVDEFQDTSPLQWRIISALTAAGATFTVVGDEKQSIYGFRGADVRVFRTAREQVTERGGERRDLSRSFRTHAPLVAVLNAFFAEFMPGPLSPSSTAARFTPLTAYREENPSDSAPCEFHVISGPQAKGQLRRAEADLLAHRIQSLLAEGRTVQDGEHSRPLSYRDIAILLRVRTNLNTYEHALFGAGIPYTVQGGRGLLARPEVRDLCQLLQFLARPDDDLALAATLRSPVVGWTDARLHGVGDRAPRQSLWAALTAQGTAPALLVELLERRASSGASALIERALEASEHAVVMASLPDGPRRLANIDAFLALLHTWAQGGEADVTRAALAVQRTLDLELPVPEALLGTDDAVQIMTIHGSKGLEFPVVIVPDLLARGRADTSALLMDADHGLAVKVPGVKGADQPPLHRTLQDLMAERRAAEDERLMYVALTRAADVLILTATAKNSEVLATTQLSGMFPREDVLRYAYGVGDIPRPEARRHQHAGTVSISGDEMSAALPESLPVTSIGVYLRCPRAFQHRYVTGRAPFTPLWRPEVLAAEGGASGAAIGSAVHQAIERGWTAAMIGTRFPHLTVTERAEVAELTGRLGQPAFAELHAASPEREVPITHTVGGVSFEGVIDAHYGGWIVDYKTDQHPNPAEHAAQLAVYADATGATRASLAYLRHVTLHTFTAPELRHGLEQVHAVTDGILAQRFAPSPSTRACRVCAYRRVCDAAL